MFKEELQTFYGRQHYKMDLKISAPLMYIPCIILSLNVRRTCKHDGYTNMYKMDN